MTRVITHHCDAGGCDESVCSEKLPEGWVTLKQTIEFKGANGQRVSNDAQKNSYDLCQACFEYAPRMVYVDRWKDENPRIEQTERRAIEAAE